MKGQLSLEFVVIILLLTSYLSVVFSLFSSARASLEAATDKKASERIGRWTTFISQRPKGTEIRLDFRAPPMGFIEISCGKITSVATRSKKFEVDVPSSCGNIMIKKESRLAIRSQGGGVEIEVI